MKNYLLEVVRECVEEALLTHTGTLPRVTRHNDAFAFHEREVSDLNAPSAAY